MGQARGTGTTRARTIFLFFVLGESELCSQIDWWRPPGWRKEKINVRQRQLVSYIIMICGLVGLHYYVTKCAPR